MRALLRGGELDGARILGDAAFRELATVNFRNAHDVAGIAHGFFRVPYGRYESLEHAGATILFHSEMVLVPDGDLGVFIATNTDTGRKVADQLAPLMIERLLPDARPPPPPAPPPDPLAGVRRFTGAYVTERRAYSTIERLMATLSPLTVSAASDGTVLMSGFGRTTRWVQDGPLTLRSLDDGDHVQFLEDGSGHVIGMASSSGTTVLTKVGFFGQPMLLFASMGALAVVCVGIFVAMWGRRGRGLGPYSRLDGIGARVTGLTAIVWLAFLVVLGLNATRLGADPVETLATYPDALLRTLRSLGYVGLVLSLGALVLYAAAFRGTGWTVGRRVRHALVLLTMLVFAAMLVKWGFLFTPYALG